ncbi:TMhelix containing protein [Vibrio phage 1.084.O._10N.261.49.F5]|nr:TMhelix containing protein [Vibrio phage 1.084.O._10N.261.49.F5]
MKNFKQYLKQDKLTIGVICLGLAVFATSVYNYTSTPTCEEGAAVLKHHINKKLDGVQYHLSTEIDSNLGESIYSLHPVPRDSRVCSLQMGAEEIGNTTVVYATWKQNGETFVQGLEEI